MFFATARRGLGCCLPLKCEDAEIDISFALRFSWSYLILYIFLDEAVISLEALMMRSLRSWCSSSSARKPSNMDMIGDEPVVLSCSSIAACGRLTPIGVMYVDFVKMRCSYAGSCLMRCCSTWSRSFRFGTRQDSFVLRRQLLCNTKSCIYQATTFACSRLLLAGAMGITKTNWASRLLSLIPGAFHAQ